MKNMMEKMEIVAAVVEVVDIFFKAREMEDNKSAVDAALLATLADMVADGNSKMAIMVLDMIGRPEVKTIETSEKQTDSSEKLTALLELVETICNE